MILQPPSALDRAPFRRPPGEDEVLPQPEIPPGGVEVITVIRAVYNGPDHKPVNGGKPVDPGRKIIISVANVDYLIDNGLVRYPEAQDEQPQIPVQDFAGMVADLLTAITQPPPDQPPAPPAAVEEEWLDYTPLLAAGIPDPVAIALFEKGFTSKGKLQDAHAEQGENALLTIEGIGPTRSKKILRWAGVVL